MPNEGLLYRGLDLEPKADEVELFLILSKAAYEVERPERASEYSERHLVKDRNRISLQEEAMIGHWTLLDPRVVISTDVSSLTKILFSESGSKSHSSKWQQIL